MNKVKSSRRVTRKQRVEKLERLYEELAPELGDNKEYFKTLAQEVLGKKGNHSELTSKIRGAFSRSGLDNKAQRKYLHMLSDEFFDLESQNLNRSLNGDPIRHQELESKIDKYAQEIKELKRSVRPGQEYKRRINLTYIDGVGEFKHDSLMKDLTRLVSSVNRNNKAEKLVEARKLVGYDISFNEAERTSLSRFSEILDDYMPKTENEKLVEAGLKSIEERVQDIRESYLTKTKVAVKFPVQENNKPTYAPLAPATLTMPSPILDAYETPTRYQNQRNVVLRGTKKSRRGTVLGLLASMIPNSGQNVQTLKGIFGKTLGLAKKAITPLLIAGALTTGGAAYLSNARSNSTFRERSGAMAPYNLSKIYTPSYDRNIMTNLVYRPGDKGFDELREKLEKGKGKLHFSSVMGNIE